MVKPDGNKLNPIYKQILTSMYPKYHNMKSKLILPFQFATNGQKNYVCPVFFKPTFALTLSYFDDYLMYKIIVIHLEKRKQSRTGRIFRFFQRNFGELPKFLITICSFFNHTVQCMCD